MFSKKLITIFIIFNILSINYVKCTQNQNYMSILPRKVFQYLNKKNIKTTNHCGCLLELPLYTSFVCGTAIEGLLEEKTEVYILLVDMIEYNKVLEIVDSNGESHNIKINEQNYSKLKNYSHKNVLKIFDIMKIDSYYCIIQERNSKSTKLYDVIEYKKPSTWLRKKIVLSKIFSLIYLHSHNIFRNRNDYLFTLIDEYYNVKNGMLLQTKFVDEVLAMENRAVYFYQNVVFNLYNTKEHNQAALDELKTFLIEYDRSNLHDFCNYITTKGIENGSDEEINGFKEFFSTLDIKSDDYFEKIINHEFFKENMILTPDFRKWKFFEQRMSNFVFKHMKNKVVFEFINKPQIIEIEYIENEDNIKLDSGMLHYRSLNIIIDGILLDIDNLDEEGFKTFHKRIDLMFSEVNFYMNNKLKLEIYNEYFNFLCLEKPGCYRLIYKKNKNNDYFDLYFEINNKDVNMIDPWESIPKDKSQEFLENTKIFILNLIKETECYQKRGFTESIKKFVCYKSSISVSDDIFTLPYVYIPGLGIRKEEKAEDFKSFTRYFFDECCIELKNGMAFFRQRIDLNDIETIEDVHDRSEFIGNVCDLLEASFVEIQF